MGEHEHEQPATDPGPAEQGPEATEAARELAAANMVDLDQIQGTGADGKITKADVEQHLGGGRTSTATMPPGYEPVSPGAEGPKVWEGTSEAGGE